MKEKKKLWKQIIIYVVIVIVTAGATYGITNLIDKKQIDKFYEDVGDAGIHKLTEVTDFTLPEFTITVFGSTKDVITELTIKDLKIYKIDATTINNGKKMRFTFTGIRLKEALALINIDDKYEYSTITFKSTDGVQNVYNKENITDNVFLVFATNGKIYTDKKVNLMNFDGDTIRNVENLIRMDIY